MKNVGVISMGIKCPIIRQGDDLSKIVVKSILDSTWITTVYEDVPDEKEKSTRSLKRTELYDLSDKDVIGITESIVARAAGNYVTLDEISEEIKTKLNNPEWIIVANPIYSRNRFSMILKAIARATSEGIIICMPDADEVGNPSGVNQFTGINIKEYYGEIVQNEGKKCIIHEFSYSDWPDVEGDVIYCGLHDYESWKEDYGDESHITLADICNDKCEYGLLGSNKATEEKLKLFPSKRSAQELVEKIQKKIFDKTGKTVEVMVYGDGCFKDPIGGIWEFADPETSPAYTSGLEGTPNEIKIKAFADDQFKDLNGSELDKAVKKAIKDNCIDLVGNMASQGTTPRRYVDLLASLMDLTSGSGSKGTPIILVKNYFKNYSNE